MRLVELEEPLPCHRLRDWNVFNRHNLEHRIHQDTALPSRKKVSLTGKVQMMERRAIKAQDREGEPLHRRQLLLPLEDLVLSFTI